jgi:hypothetical protein
MKYLAGRLGGSEVFSIECSRQGKVKHSHTQDIKPYAISLRKSRTVGLCRL